MVQAQKNSAALRCRWQVRKHRHCRTVQARLEKRVHPPDSCSATTGSYATRAHLLRLLVQPASTKHGARRKNASRSLRCGSSCECEAKVRAEISMAEAESMRRAAHQNQGSTGREAPPHCWLPGGPKAPARRRIAQSCLTAIRQGCTLFSHRVHV